MIGKTVKVNEQWWNSFLEKVDICEVGGKENGYDTIYWLKRLNDGLEQAMPSAYFDEVK